MDTIVSAVLIALSVMFGFILGFVWRSDALGQLKYENERLNGEVKRLTDRDARGRFKK